jgi:2-(1,2-epoxy-1,2-dihydrophenyl)acetyl-CoA isomerase
MTPVAVNVDRSVATSSRERPDRLNALDLETRRSLLYALRTAAADQAMRSVISTRSGCAFCSGQDLAAGKELVDTGATVAESYNPLVSAITGMDKPLIAAVNGAPVDADMGLALSCDEIVMAQSAFFSGAFVRVGLVPDPASRPSSCDRAGTLQRSGWRAQRGRASAEEALILGPIDEVVAAGSPGG